jgi:uncharacterized iron-regulated membrane protein
MSWLHTWSGILFGWILYFIFITGTLGYFDAEIDRWMRPELPLASTALSEVQATARGAARLAEVAPFAESWKITLPHRNDNAELSISWRNRASDSNPFGSRGAERLDPAEPVEVRRTGGGQLLYQMHYNLHYLNHQTAYWIVGAAAMAMLVALISGVITHKKFFADFFTFRPRKPRRSWLDAHNLLSVAALPFQVLITYSGLVFFMFTYMPLVVEGVYGDDAQPFYNEAYPSLAGAEPTGIEAPLVSLEDLVAKTGSGSRPGRLLSITVDHPGDAGAQVIVARERDDPQNGVARTYFNGASGALLSHMGDPRFGPRKFNDTLLGLHEGLFAGPGLRWLYFLSGLAGAAMIASGLVFWTLKRGGRNAAGSPAPVGLFLVERLNAGMLVGLPIGIAAYFWANRMLPLELEARGAWEAHTLFLCWGTCILFAMIRPARQAWTALLGIAAFLYAALPLLNRMTSDRHLGVTLPLPGRDGDWGLAGFDLTAIVTGIALLIAAWRVAKHGDRARGTAVAA